MSLSGMKEEQGSRTGKVSIKTSLTRFAKREGARLNFEVMGCTKGNSVVVGALPSPNMADGRRPI